MGPRHARAQHPGGRRKAAGAAAGKPLAFGDNYAMADAGAIYPGVRFIRTAAMLSENLIVFLDRLTADQPHTFDLAAHYTGAWKELPPGEKVSLPYKHVEDTTTRRACSALAPIHWQSLSPTMSQRRSSRRVPAKAPQSGSR